MSAVEDRLYRAIVGRFEGIGEAWTTDTSGDTLARAAAEEAVRELRLMSPEEEPLAAILTAKQRLADARADLSRTVTAAHDAGHSWHQIGAALGTTRQAAHERFGKAVGDA